jgi:hypothetical protein
MDYAKAVSVSSHLIITAVYIDSSIHRSGSNTPGTYTLKGNSKTSSIIIRRYEKQPSTDDPFSIFPDSLNQAHEELAAFGSWTNCEDPEPPYGICSSTDMN